MNLRQQKNSTTLEQKEAAASPEKVGITSIVSKLMSLTSNTAMKADIRLLKKTWEPYIDELKEKINEQKKQSAKQKTNSQSGTEEDAILKFVQMAESMFKKIDALTESITYDLYMAPNAEEAAKLHPKNAIIIYPYPNQEEKYFVRVVAKSKPKLGIDADVDTITEIKLSKNLISAKYKPSFAFSSTEAETKAEASDTLRNLISHIEAKDITAKETDIYHRHEVMITASNIKLIVESTEGLAKLEGIKSKQGYQTIMSGGMSIADELPNLIATLARIPITPTLKSIRSKADKIYKKFEKLKNQLQPVSKDVEDKEEPVDLTKGAKLFISRVESELKNMLDGDVFQDYFINKTDANSESPWVQQLANALHHIKEIIEKIDTLQKKNPDLLKSADTLSIIENHINNASDLVSAGLDLASALNQLNQNSYLRKLLPLKEIEAKLKISNLFRTAESYRSDATAIWASIQQSTNPLSAAIEKLNDIFENHVDNAKISMDTSTNKAIRNIGRIADNLNRLKKQIEIDPEEKNTNILKFVMDNFIQILEIKKSLPDIQLILSKLTHEDAKKIITEINTAFKDLTLLGDKLEIQLNLKKGYLTNRLKPLIESYYEIINKMGYDFSPTDRYPYQAAINKQRDELFADGYDLLLMSENDFKAISENHRPLTSPVLIKIDADRYKLWGYREGKWQLAELENFKAPVDWNTKTAVYVSNTGLNQTIFETLKSAHTLTETNLPALQKKLIIARKDKEEHKHNLQNVFAELNAKPDIDAKKEQIEEALLIHIDDLESQGKTLSNNKKHLDNLDIKIIIFSALYKVSNEIDSKHSGNLDEILKKFRANYDSDYISILYENDSRKFLNKLELENTDIPKTIALELSKLKKERGSYNFLFSIELAQILENRINACEKLQLLMQSHSLKDALIKLDPDQLKLLKKYDSPFLNHLESIEKALPYHQKPKTMLGNIDVITSKKNVTTIPNEMSQEHLDAVLLIENRLKELSDSYIITHTREIKIRLLTELKTLTSKYDSFETAINKIKDNKNLAEHIHLLFEGKTGKEIKKALSITMTKEELLDRLDAEINNLKKIRYSHLSVFSNINKNVNEEHIEILQDLKAKIKDSKTSIKDIIKNLNPEEQELLQKYEPDLLKAFKKSPAANAPRQK